MRLDQGPTASFKDFAARMMARLMSHFREKGKRLNVLVATSGDTGSAVGEAFKGVEGIDVTILYPRGEVSGIQKKQLDTIGENVRALSVAGKFDDCQNLVKQAFSPIPSISEGFFLKSFIMFMLMPSFPENGSRLFIPCLQATSEMHLAASMRDEWDSPLPNS